jgi:hypothetical protein
VGAKSFSVFWYLCRWTSRDCDCQPVLFAISADTNGKTVLVVVGDYSIPFSCLNLTNLFRTSFAPFFI